MTKQPLEGTYIPGGVYVSQAKACEYLELTSLQYHIKAENIRTVNFPVLGHMILVEDVLEFEENRRGQGRPTIYEKK